MADKKKGEEQSSPKVVSPSLAPVAATFLGVKASVTLSKQGEKRPLKAIRKAERMRVKSASADEIHRATSKMLEGTPYAGVTYGADMKPRFEVDDSTASVKRSAIPAGGTASQEKFLDHPELYKAAPYLKDLKVGRSGHGGAQVAGNEIQLSNKAFLSKPIGGAEIAVSERAKGENLHELQHAVQDAEGHAPGGSPDDFKNKPGYKGNRAKQVEGYRRLAGEVEAEMTRERAGMSAAERRANRPVAPIAESQQIIMKTGGKRELIDYTSIADAARAAYRTLMNRDVADGKTVRFRKIDPANVTADAETFQFKSGGDAAGVTDRLKGVTSWDSVAAGKTVMWERKDGKLFIGDGHQRLGLAKRLQSQGQKVEMDAYVMREADGWSPRDVRVYAAIKNMKEGSGTSLDMAKVVRERPDLVNGSLPMSDGKVKDAIALSKLSPDAFGMVVNGVVKPEHAAAVGNIADTGRHATMLKEMQAANITSSQHARLYVQQAMAAPQYTETTGSLFGDQVETRSLLAERAKVLDKAIQSLKSDKKIFGLLEREAGSIESAGNKLVHEVNAERAQGAGRTAELVEKLAATRGPVSSMLDKAALALAEGKSPSVAAREFTKAVHDTLKTSGIAGLTGEAPKPAPAPVDPNQANMFGGSGERPGWSDEARAASAEVRAENAKDNAKKEPVRAMVDDAPKINDLKAEMARIKAMHARADEIMHAELAKPNPKLVVNQSKYGIKHVMTKMPTGDGYRVTTFDAEGVPTGHREYGKDKAALDEMRRDLVSGGLGKEEPVKAMLDGEKPSTKGNPQSQARWEKELAKIPVDDAEKRLLERKKGERMNKKTKMMADKDMFGGPTTKDEIQAKSRKMEAKGRTGDAMNDGLFGSSKDQMDLVDAAKKPAAAPEGFTQKGRVGEFEYGYKGKQDWIVRDRRTGDIVGKGRNLSEASNAAQRQHAIDKGEIKIPPAMSAKSTAAPAKKAFNYFPKLVSQIADETKAIVEGRAKGLSETRLAQLDRRADALNKAAFSRAARGDEAGVKKADALSKYVDDLRTPTQAAKRLGWSDAAREASAKARGVAAPGEAKPAETKPARKGKSKPAAVEKTGPVTLPGSKVKWDAGAESSKISAMDDKQLKQLEYSNRMKATPNMAARHKLVTEEIAKRAKAPAGGHSMTWDTNGGPQTISGLSAEGAKAKAAEFEKLGYSTKISPPAEAEAAAKAKDAGRNPFEVEKDLNTKGIKDADGNVWKKQPGTDAWKVEKPAKPTKKNYRAIVDGKEVGTRTSERTYSHVVIGRENYANDMKFAGSIHPVDKSNFRYYQNISGPDKGAGEYKFPISDTEAERAREIIKKHGSADDYAKAMAAERVAKVNANKAAGKYDSLHAITWAGREDLAHKQVPGLSKNFADVKVVPVTVADAKPAKPRVKDAAVKDLLKQGLVTKGDVKAAKSMGELTALADKGKAAKDRDRGIGREAPKPLSPELQAVKDNALPAPKPKRTRKAKAAPAPAPATPGKPIAPAASAGPVGWSDAARVASAESRGVALPGEAVPPPASAGKPARAPKAKPAAEVPYQMTPAGQEARYINRAQFSGSTKSTAELKAEFATKSAAKKPFKGRKALGLLMPVAIGTAMLAASNQAKAEGRSEAKAALQAGAESGATMVGFTAGSAVAVKGLMKAGMTAARAAPVVQGAFMAYGAVSGALEAYRHGGGAKDIAVGAAKGAWDMSLPGMIVNTARDAKAVIDERRSLSAPAPAAPAAPVTPFNEALSNFKATGQGFKGFNVANALHNAQAAKAQEPADGKGSTRGFANAKVQAAAQEAKGRKFSGKFKDGHR